MTGLTDLPDEILIQILGRLVLKDLIRGIGVCVKWRGVILDDKSIHPVRKALLDLYLHVISTPDFVEDRAVNADGFYDHFDRQAYLREVKEEYRKWKKEVRQIDEPDVQLPKDFEMYILEWPAKAIVDRLWPGLRDISMFLHYVPLVSAALVVDPKATHDGQQREEDMVLLPVLLQQALGMGWGVYVLLEGYVSGDPNHRPLKPGQGFHLDRGLIHLEEEGQSQNQDDGPWAWISFVRTSARVRFVTNLARKFGYGNSKKTSTGSGRQVEKSLSQRIGKQLLKLVRWQE